MPIDIQDIIAHNIATATSVFAGIAIFIAGTIVYVRDTKKLNNVFSFFLTISLGAWSIAAGIFGEIAIQETAELVARFIYLTSVSIPFFLLMFSMTLTAERRTVFTTSTIALVVPYLIAAVLVLVPGAVIEAVEMKAQAPSRFVFGPGYPFFAVFMGIYFALSFITLLRKYTESAGIFRPRMKYILVGIILAGVTALITDMILPAFGVFAYVWIGPLVALVAVLLIAYLIARYNFWSVKLLATEFFVSLLVLVFLGQVLFVESAYELALKMLVLALIAAAGVFLVRSVKHEIESNEQVKRFLADLEEANRDLRQLDERKSEFIKIAAHHLRDPLTTISGYASMMLEGVFGGLPQKMQEALQKIFQSSNRLVVIVEDFMDVSRIETGEMKYAFSAFDLKELLYEIADEMKLHAQKTGLSIHTRIDPDSTYAVYADKGKIRQVITNLIDNAVKYTSAGSVEIALWREDNNVLFKVSDSGIGMDKETLSKIFKKFSRAEGINRLYTEGSGLGLYVAREIIKKHKGRIWAESKGIGKGASFFIELQADT